MSTETTTSPVLTLTRMRARVDRGVWSQTWSHGGAAGGGPHVTVSRKTTAKAERVTVSVVVMNPYWDIVLFPAVDGETNGNREARHAALATSAGAVYEHGIIGWTGKAQDLAAGLAAAVGVLGRLGITAVLPVAQPAPTHPKVADVPPSDIHESACLDMAPGFDSVTEGP